MKIPQQTLTHLRGLLDAATPGKWYQTGDPWFKTGSGVLAGSPDPHVAPMVADCETWEGEREEFNENHQGAIKLVDADADAAFICAAKNHMRELLDRVEELDRNTPSREEVAEALQETTELVQIMHNQLSQVTGENTIYKPLLDRVKQALAALPEKAMTMQELCDIAVQENWKAGRAVSYAQFETAFRALANAGVLMVAEENKNG